MAGAIPLKDGSQVHMAVYLTVNMSLKAVLEKNSTALSDLVKKCKDAKYKLNDNPLCDSKKILTDYSLIDGEEIHEDIRKIVLNSVDVSGAEPKLVSPFASKQIKKM